MKHREPWCDLLIAPFNNHGAEARFKSIVGDRCELLARNPHDARADPIGVKFVMPERMQHLFYKNGVFQEDRAERICWIPEALIRPGRTFWKLGDDGKTIHHYYACDVSDQEEFVVIVDQYSDALFQFKTAIPYEKARWEGKKSQYRKGPQKK